MIRALHFADAHIGVTTHGRPDASGGLNSRVVDFLAALDEIVEEADNAIPDIILFAGDAFHHRNPTQLIQREFASRILKLSDIAPVVLLIGNHDTTQTREGHALEIYDTLRVNNVWVGDKYEARRIPTAAGDLIVATAPYPVRRWLLSDKERNTLSIPDQIMGVEQLVAENINRLAEDVERLDPEGDTARVLMGHFSVTGSFWAAEREVMAGHDVVVNTHRMARRCWDYIALGHIHKHQDVLADEIVYPPVVYSGSIERATFNEEGEQKGYCWVELVRALTSWEFWPLHTSRPMGTIEFDCREMDDPTEFIVGQAADYELDGDIVRIKIRINYHQDRQLARGPISRAFVNAGADTVVINRQIERVKGKGNVTVSVDSLDDMERLALHFDRKGVEEKRKELLLTVAAALIKHEPSDNELTAKALSAERQEALQDALDRIILGDATDVTDCHPKTSSE